MTTHTVLYNLSTGINDCDKVWFEGSTSHKETINVSCLGQLLAVAGRDRPSVNDAGGLCHLRADIVPQPLAKLGMDILGLLLIIKDNGELHSIPILHYS